MISPTSLANLSTVLSGDVVLGLAQAAAGAASAANRAQVVDPRTLHPGWAPAWAFWILATLTVGGAITTILQRNLISAVMSLVATFFGIASLYALLSAHFLAAIQVLVYAGAIMVLFVFAIMVLNRDEVNPVPESGVLDRALGAGALVYLVWRLGELIASPVGASVRAGRPSADYGTVGKIGDYFFDQFLFPFEAVSILLVIAVIGAVVLARTTAKPTTPYEIAGATPTEADRVHNIEAGGEAGHGHGHGDQGHGHGHAAHGGGH
jgi:NADH-quinone oxidoreductase subunit J